MEHHDVDQSAPWFSVHELTLYAYHLQQEAIVPSEGLLQLPNSSPSPLSIDSTSDSIAHLYQSAQLDVLQPFMASNQPCIVHDVTQSPRTFFLPDCQSDQADISNDVQHAKEKDQPQQPQRHNHKTLQPAAPLPLNEPSPAQHFNWRADNWITTPHTTAQKHSYLSTNAFYSDELWQQITTNTNNSTDVNNAKQFIYQLHKDVESLQQSDQLQHSRPNLDYLQHHYASMDVTVSSFSQPDVSYPTKLGEYLSTWKEYQAKVNNDGIDEALGVDHKKTHIWSSVPLTSRNLPSSRPIFNDYARDLHLDMFDHHHTDTFNLNPTSHHGTTTSSSFYMTPLCCSDDYLNHYWDYLHLVQLFDKHQVKDTVHASVLCAEKSHPDENQQQNNSSQSSHVVNEMEDVSMQEQTHPPSIFDHNRSYYSDDYRFVYLGPHSSLTHLHRDVYGSYSWSLNVAGCKLWIFFPPTFVPLFQNDPFSSTNDLCDIFDEKLVQQFSEQNVTLRLHGLQHQQQKHDTTHNNTPNLSNASLYFILQMWLLSLRNKFYPQFFPITDQQRVTISQLREIWGVPKLLLQGTKDLVFVPSFWSHLVVNITDCISINHNWVNAYNMPFMASQLLLDVLAVKAQRWAWKNQEEVLVFDFDNKLSSSLNESSRIMSLEHPLHLPINNHLSIPHLSQSDRSVQLHELSKSFSGDISLLSSFQHILKIPAIPIDYPIHGIISSLPMHNETTAFPHDIIKPLSSPFSIIELQSVLTYIQQSSPLVYQPDNDIFGQLVEEHRFLFGNCGMSLFTMNHIVITNVLFYIASLLMLYDAIICILSSTQNMSPNQLHSQDPLCQISSNEINSMINQCKTCISSILNIISQIDSQFRVSRSISAHQLVLLFIVENQGFIRLIRAPLDNDLSHASRHSLLRSHLEQEPKIATWMNLRYSNNHLSNTPTDKHSTRIICHFDSHQEAKFYGLSSLFACLSANLHNTTFWLYVPMYMSYIILNLTQIHSASQFVYKHTDFTFLWHIAACLLTCEQHVYRFHPHARPTDSIHSQSIETIEEEHNQNNIPCHSFCPSIINQYNDIITQSDSRYESLTTLMQQFKIAAVPFFDIFELIQSISQASVTPVVQIISRVSPNDIQVNDLSKLHQQLLRSMHHQ